MRRVRRDQLILVKIRKQIQKWFATGLLVVVPLGAIVFILWFVYIRLHRISQPLIIFLSRELEAAGLQFVVELLVPWAGLLILLLLILVVGIVTSLAVGRKLLLYWESILSRLPLISSVYSVLKQVMELITTESSMSFKQVVMIEYPRRGIYSLAFVTSGTLGEVQDRTGEEVVSVFLPTTPNPTSGFLLLVPKEDIIPLAMTVEQGVKMIISAGLVVPPYDPENPPPKPTLHIKKTPEERRRSAVRLEDKEGGWVR